MISVARMEAVSISVTVLVILSWRVNFPLCNLLARHQMHFTLVVVTRAKYPLFKEIVLPTLLKEDVTARKTSTSQPGSWVVV